MGKWSASLRPTLPVVVELGLLLVATIWLGWGLFQPDPWVIPYGADFLPNLQTQHFWDRVKECGTCALWNGSELGGIPALIDIIGANLHPLSATLFILFGPINGSKLLVVCSIWLAGLGQWLLAREMGLSRIPRVWAGLIAATGAHLAGRMDGGLVTMLLSVAMASLVLPVSLRLARNPTRKTTVLLGFLLALTGLSGQGYIQIGMLLSAPLFLILLLNERLHFEQSARYFLVSIGLATLLAAPLLVPFLHFAPHFNKHGEPEFNNGQPLKYLALNLVINNWEFLSSDHLEKPGMASMNILFIGWTPVLLCGLSLAFLREKRRMIAFLWLYMVCLLWIASAEPLRLLNGLIPAASYIRFPTLIASLAIVPLLGLSSFALDRLLRIDWSIHFTLNTGHMHSFRFAWLILIPLTLNFLENREFSAKFYKPNPVDFSNAIQVLNKIDQTSTQWISLPDGEWQLLEMATQMKMKVTPGFTIYEWKDRSFPKAKWVIRDDEDTEEGAERVARINQYSVYRFPTGNEYAAIYNENGDEIQPCTASGLGGDIRVHCSSDAPGTLVVKENQWNGWYAWLNGIPTTLKRGQWLSVAAPAGESTYQFRYLPWDVPLGILLCLVGIGLSIWMWRKIV
jgi:hypothetical protein